MQKNKKNEGSGVSELTRLALIAAAYVALTVAVAPLSYGMVQFRFSEVLVLLCFYRRDNAAALILGCFIANLFSPMFLTDMVFGTLATALAVIPMYFMKNIYLAAVLPVISNGILVGAELTIAFGGALWLNMACVAAGELAVVVIGAVIFKLIFERSPRLMKLIGSTRQHKAEG